MRQLLLFIFLFYLTSCEYEKYPPENYTISQKFRNLISSFKINDTIKFKDNKDNYISLLIDNIDSTLHNKRGQFINAREYKDISISCRELTNPQKGYDNYNLILINKYADEDSATFNIRLMNFFSADKSLPINQKQDTIFANALTFTNYYVFRPNNYRDLHNPDSVTEIYMTEPDGIIAFRYLNGRWWTKVE